MTPDEKASFRVAASGHLTAAMTGLMAARGAVHDKEDSGEGRAGRIEDVKAAIAAVARLQKWYATEPDQEGSNEKTESSGRAVAEPNFLRRGQR